MPSKPQKISIFLIKISNRNRKIDFIIRLIKLHKNSSYSEDIIIHQNHLIKRVFKTIISDLKNHHSQEYKNVKAFQKYCKISKITQISQNFLRISNKYPNKINKTVFQSKWNT